MMGNLKHGLIKLRPRDDTLYVSQSRTVLATDRDGFIRDGAQHGLFVNQTRMLSRYRWLINGREPQPVALSSVEQHSWLGYYITLPAGIPTGEPDLGSGMVQPSSQQTLELRLSRYVGEGLHEDVDLTNFTQQHTSLRLELEVDADFADQVETNSGRQQFGELMREWREAGSGVGELVFDYRAAHDYQHPGYIGTAHLHCGLTLRAEHADAAPAWADGRLVFHIDLPAQATWYACLNLIPHMYGEPKLPLYGCRSFTGIHNEYDRRRMHFLGETTRFSTPASHALAPVVIGALQQAEHDLAALRLYDLDHGTQAWTMAAGLPIYIALFGRDTLTTAWQAALASTALMRGTLLELARWQGTTINDWRDEQPGRHLHEAHTGPLEMLNYNPRSRNYGSITTSGFYPVVVAQLWHWTGDKALIRPLLEPACKGLQWLDQHSDLDGNGFYEYLTRSAQGVKHQAWKDSSDAIVYEDGSQVAPPIATCEEQGFVYLAKYLMSEVLWWFGEKDTAKRLYRDAMELRKRFNDAFWMDDEGFFALGLDKDKRQIRSITSNPGHCLAAGIVDQHLVQRTADRLFADDLFTGWGIRTLSSQHPAYNPYSYHRGSVWPVEHATFAFAFMRYGLTPHLHRLVQAQFEATALFDHYRLPELFSGHQRDADHPFPAFYPQANSPQAWSASAIFCFVQALLGLYPYAPLHMLLVDPQLPAWLPEITLTNLHIGNATVSMRFYRRADGRSDYRVLDKRGRLHILRQPSPWSLTASRTERVLEAWRSLLPGR